MEESVSKIAIYSRKSKFTGKGESIENQIELCRQYIRVHFPDFPEACILTYEDEGFSGGNTERPEFRRMMADARAKRFSAVVCYRLDRISRNTGDFTRLIEELETLKISFISIREQFDTSSPMGRAMMYISSVFSQLERETIAERIRDNMRELSKTGRWLGGITPTGYESESVESVNADGKVKKSYRLKPISEEADVVRLIYEKFLETSSLTKTEAYFMKAGGKTKNGRAFTRFALKNILTNPVYMLADADAYTYLTKNAVGLFADKAEFDGKHGVIVYNRTTQKAGRANQIRPMNEWIAAVGRHEGLVSGARWMRVQENLAQNCPKPRRKPRSGEALLSGLLVCGCCGDYMRPKLSRRTNEQGERVFSYLCATKEKSRSNDCQMKNAAGNILDKAVFTEISKLNGDLPEFIKRLGRGRLMLSESQNECDESMERLNRTITENEREIVALAGSLARVSSTAAEGYIVRQIEELHEKNEAAKRRAEELKSAAAEQALDGEAFEETFQKLFSFERVLCGMSIAEKRAAMRLLIKKAIWDGVNVRIIC